MPKRNIKDIIGKTFGCLKVLEYGSVKRSDRFMIVQCDCPDKTILEVRRYSLMNGGTLSCGCLRRKSAKEHSKYAAHIKAERIHQMKWITGF